LPEICHFPVAMTREKKRERDGKAVAMKKEKGGEKKKKGGKRFFQRAYFSANCLERGGK